MVILFELTILYSKFKQPLCYKKSTFKRFKMRTIFLLTFALVLSLFAYSQTILENPKVGMNTASYVTLEKIELSDTTTVLWFHVKFAPGNWISIPKETYIQPVGAKEKLYIVSADGITLGEKYTMPASGEVNYKLVFPKVDASVSKIDYGETVWFIYDIQLKPELFKSIVPEKLTGNWFRSDNAQWEISLFDSVAVYKSQVWKYQQYSEKDGTCIIGLKNGKKTLNIYTKLIDDSTCMIGESPAKLIRYSQQPDESVIPADNETFSLPVFNVDTAIYSGYINGFSPRFPQRTGMVYVNDVLTGEQVSHLLKIADDGSFRVKFPHSNPQGVFVRLPFLSETVFIEPGKAIFHLIDGGSNLFMGDGARINTELLKLKNINGFDHNQMMDKILDFSPEQYKSWCQDLLQKDSEALASFARVHSLSAKAVQVKQMELDYRNATNTMSYSMNFESAYRKKNKIPQTQRELPIERAKLDSAYYSFLNNELVNNPLAVLAYNYFSFLNRVMFMELLRSGSKATSMAENMLAMEKAGYAYSPEDKPVSIRMKEVYTPELTILLNEFSNKFGKQSRDFNKKYDEILKPFFQDKKPSERTASLTKECLIGQNIELSEDELALINAMEVLQTNPAFQDVMQLQDEKLKMSSQFNTEYMTFTSNLSKERMIADRKEKMQKILGIQPGLATDIMASQDICRPIVAEMTPCPDEKIREFQQEITTPFIAGYIALKNDESKAKIEANKTQKGANVNEVPKTEGDKVFDAIMAKFKGKVVYVDFWATWCAPCRSGIERIKPLKDEMANENVAFVYITSPSSPKTTYDNMIPTIKGEHYFVSNDEWNILGGMFKISGIPHYVLVGKDGKVINPQLGHLENAQLKTLLMKHIKE